NGFCNQLLAGACCPLDQHGRAGRRHDAHHAKYALESGAVANNPTYAAAFAVIEPDFLRSRVLDFKASVMDDCGRFNCPACTYRHCLLLPKCVIVIAFRTACSKTSG